MTVTITPRAPPIELEQPDFRAEFDQRTKSWTVSWKWSSDQPPEKLYNRVPEYTIPVKARAEYDKELQNWIDNGWLVPYPEDKLGPPKDLIPLMAVIQQNKQKVRLVQTYAPKSWENGGEQDRMYPC